MKKDNELRKQAESDVRLAYAKGASLNALVPRYGTELVNEMCDLMEKENAPGTANNPPACAAPTAPPAVEPPVKPDLEAMRLAILNGMVIHCKNYCGEFFSPKSLNDKTAASKEALGAGWTHRRGWLCPACTAKLPPRKLIEVKGDRQVFEVGEFKIGMSGKIVICDPCYDELEGGMLKACPGKWVGFVVTRTGNWFGGTPHDRTVMLLAMHESLRGRVKAFISGKLPKGVKSRTAINRGVDTCQMAIFDADADMAEELYEECCNKSELGGIINGVGVVSDTCLGDGGYGGSIWKDKEGGVVAASMKFWSLTGRTI